MKSISCCFGLIVVLVQSSLHADEYLNGIKWEEPKVVTVGKNGVPADAVVLLGGGDLSAWNNADNWKLDGGVMVAGKGDVTSKAAFGDCQLHIEWSAATPPTGEGQGRSNSGVFLMNTYEIQILDSYKNKTYFDGQAGGIYKQTPPQVNVTRPPGEWNVYDIVWSAPRFNEDGTLKSPAYITALHNGVLVLNHFELQGDTPYHRPPGYTKHADKLPIRLQDHGNPVRFRNIWVREIGAAKGERARPAFIKNSKTGEEVPVK